jgi:hypothetical protein
MEIARPSIPRDDPRKYIDEKSIGIDKILATKTDLGSSSLNLLDEYIE